MRIACLQFAPVLGDVDNNLNRADLVLDQADPQDLDLLVLPELAFSGYNFKSLGDILRYLEPTGTGISSLWARSQALKHDCTVIVGYPEKVDLADRWPASPEYYNSAVVVNSEGEDVGNYRKSHLYYTDESWALEGSEFFSQSLEDLGKTAIGICMDLNPYKFQAPWDKFEFATHVLNTGAKLVVVSMAWITHEDQWSFTQKSGEPDMDTLTYWISRMEPIIRADSDEEVIVVFANRTGLEEEATYTGTSAVVGVKSGEVSVYGILGRGENKLLVVDTDDQPFAKLVYRPEGKSKKATEPEPSKPIRRDTDGRESEYGRSSEPRSSKRQDVGETEPTRSHERGNRSSPNRRDNLAVKIPEKDQFEKQYGNPGVHTPSGPSPTPHNVRPQFVNQHSDSNIHVRNDTHQNTSYNHPSGDEPLVIDPEATARRLGLIRNLSPSNRSESQGSNYSMNSAKLYWNPREQNAVEPTRRHRLDNTDQMISDFASIKFGEDNRHSIRSDIAVWNNEPGHPRELISFPNASQEQSVRSTLHATERNRDVTRSVNQSRNGPPGMSKTRNESRAGRPDRSVSSILPPPDMVAACERFEEFAQRAETAQGRFDSMREPDRDPATVSSNRESRNANPSRQRSTRPPSQSKLRRQPSKGSMPVPFAIDSSAFRDSNRSNTTLNERSTSPSGMDPPILRPASRSRINREGNRGRGLEIDIPIPDTTLFDHRIRSARAATQEHRATSRGRTRAAAPPEIHSADLTKPRNTRHGAHKRHESAQDAIDLSQFALIEEYPSKHCLLHGSRSRSRAGHRHSSRQRATGTPRTRPPSSSRHGKEIQRSVQNTPLTGNRRAPGVVAKVPFKLTTDMRTTDSSGSQGQHRPSDSVSTIPSSASTLSPGQDPKTPVAMVLSSDREDTQPPAHMSWLPTMKGVGRDADVNHSRSMSVGY